MNRGFVVLDRDGTIIFERHYLSSPDQVEILPGAAEGMKQLIDLGYSLVIVTNQSGLGRGYFTKETLEAVHARLRELLAASGVSIAAIYVCPHTPDDDCDCRKPGTKLIRQAATDLGFEPSACVMVGDKACDIDMGKAVGARTVLVRTGYGARSEAAGLTANHVVDHLLQLSEILQSESRAR